MSDATTHEAGPAATGGPPPRARSLARIRALAARLREWHVEPPDAYAWSEHVEHRWWAIGDPDRVVRDPLKFGWAVGDYPWEGLVSRGHERFGSEVFLKPTYVDAEGRVVPQNPSRAEQLDNHLLTDEMCAEIAARMEAVVHRAEQGRTAPSRPSAEHPRSPWPAHRDHSGSG